MRFALKNLCINGLCIGTAIFIPDLNDQNIWIEWESKCERHSKNQKSVSLIPTALLEPRKDVLAEI